MTPDPSHHDKIRERFTETADVFARTVRRTRTEEAERLAERATAGLANADKLLAIDLACGPGTYTRPLAARVRHAIGADLTPAMVEKARAEAARDGITNIEFVCADIYALPFADGAAGIVSCGYAFHHMTDPARALAEMARVLQPGGRMAITDIIVREGCDGAFQNRRRARARSFAYDHAKRREFPRPDPEFGTARGVRTSPRQLARFRRLDGKCRQGSRRSSLRANAQHDGELHRQRPLRLSPAPLGKSCRAASNSCTQFCC